MNGQLLLDALILCDRIKGLIIVSTKLFMCYKVEELNLLRTCHVKDIVIVHEEAIYQLVKRGGFPKLTVRVTCEVVEASCCIFVVKIHNMDPAVTFIWRLHFVNEKVFDYVPTLDCTYRNRL